MRGLPAAFQPANRRPCREGGARGAGRQRGAHPRRSSIANARVRAQLGWGERPAGKKPRFAVGKPQRARGQGTEQGGQGRDAAAPAGGGNGRCGLGKLSCKWVFCDGSGGGKRGD